MNLYEIGVRFSKYRGYDTLTYSSPDSLAPGTIVEVPLRNSLCLGVVLAKGSVSPKITPKPISQVYAEVRLPPLQLDLLAWLRVYYPAPLSSIIQLFIPAKITGTSAPSNPKQASQKLPPLTAEQAAAMKTLSSVSGAALLHGDTGTGKTRVYLELARQSLAANKSSIILVPEIGLTPQMAETFQAQFPGQVQVIHSGLADKQRREVWRTVHGATKPQIVIGPRSALFMPLPNPGLVVVDEAHDNGYKQDQLPYYEATRAAAKLAALSNSLCLYGTATPRLADYWHLTRHRSPVVRLSKPIHASIQQPKHQVIDAAKRESFQRSGLFSEPMLTAMADRLTRNEQILVFLNRRGTARFVSCGHCGWHAACPSCATPLTYHGDTHQLQCHTCGIKELVPTVCPTCGSTELRYQRRGTKALQTELEKLFPEAKIARFDSDNTKDEALHAQYDQLTSGKVDIIVGTQIIAKGFDLANLSLICIPQADLSTYLPDFTADEQTFQLLRQVFGRVGRTAKPSTIIMQTFTPNSSIIQAAISNDWQSFYQQQLIHRKKYNLPPFAYLLQLTNMKASPSAARTAAEALKKTISQLNTKCEILGPAPRFHEKIQGKYQWQLVVKAKTRPELLEIIKQLPSGWRYNIDPTNLL